MIKSHKHHKWWDKREKSGFLARRSNSSGWTRLPPARPQYIGCCSPAIGKFGQKLQPLRNCRTPLSPTVHPLLCAAYTLSLDIALAPIYYALFAPARWSEKYLVGLLILLRLFLVLPELHWTGAQIRDRLQKEEKYKYMNILCKYYLLSWAELVCAN